MSKQDQIRQYLYEQAIVVDACDVKHSFLDPKDEITGMVVGWNRRAKQTESTIDLANTSAVSMGIASMAAVQYLDCVGDERVLDTCAAPGMKSLCIAQSFPCIDLYSNDLSFDRIERMKRLFATHEVSSTVTKSDARFLDSLYETDSFDRILVDAPCSGEGVILAGDLKMLQTWSPAKVKRLQQLQIKILKTAWKLLKPRGRLVYATCTLNRNENERVIKKALGISVDVRETPLELDTLPQLKHAQAWRILTSSNSIGFFIATLDKSDEID